jgi:hypothetical protein
MIRQLGLADTAASISQAPAYRADISSAGWEISFADPGIHPLAARFTKSRCNP